MGKPPRAIRVFAHCVRFVFCGGQCVSAIGSLPDGNNKKVSRKTLTSLSVSTNDKLITCSTGKLMVEP